MKNKKRIFILFCIVIVIIIVYCKENIKKQPINTIKIINYNSLSESIIYDTDEVLLNPGKGLVLRDNRDNKYNNIVSILYYRFYWKDFEKEENNFDWSKIDDLIEYCKRNHKKCAFGIMSASQGSSEKYITPKWVFDAGAEYYEYNNQVIPVWNDKVFIEKLNNFIKALGERYDGNQYIEYIDIRSYGNWGEQHLGGIGGKDISSEKLYNTYIKLYSDNFKKTMLVNPWGKDVYDDSYKKSIDNGISIRRDGIMYYNNGKEIFDYAYGKLPTIFEYVNDYKTLKEKNYWSKEKLIKYIEEWKPSYTEFFPDMYKDDSNFCKYIANKVGYYFRFYGAQYKNEANDNEDIKIELNFKNEGVAPLYDKCSVYIGLLDYNYNVVSKYKTEIKAKDWSPNEEIKEETYINFMGVDTGNYILAVGLFYNDEDEKPTYLMGSSGKTKDNWYIFGKISITNVSSKMKEIDSMLSCIIKVDKNLYNNYYESIINDDFITEYRELIEELNLLRENILEINQDNIDTSLAKQFKVFREYQKYIDYDNNVLEDFINIVDNYNILYKYYFESDDYINIENIKDELNNLIIRYNENMDIDLKVERELINKAREVYNSQLTNDTNSSKYFYKQELLNFNNIISELLNDNIKKVADEESKNIRVQYNVNINLLTNQNVIGSIILPNEKADVIDCVNNKIEFIENGKKNIRINIRGYEYNYEIEVTNIDKISPLVNGVTEGKLYTSKVTPTITDENLDEIKLTLNGEKIKSFKSGTTLTKEGFYVLTATDKAGNKTRISFQIMENSNPNYIIKDNIIKNISEQTIKSDFDNKLKLGIIYKITRNEKEIASTDNIATGDILTTSAGDKYTLIVAGDINKDGKVDLKDLIKIRKSILDDSNLESNEVLAADCNSDGKINLKDLVKIRLMILNKDATK